MTQTNQMRRGFTMIELIFVIVIIGILAAVAIPKLSATRDDAKAAKAVANLKTCVNDIGSYYTSTTKETPSSTADTDGALGFDSCKAVKDDGAFVIAGVENTTSADGNITVSEATPANDGPWVAMAHASAEKKGLSISGDTKTHVFGGSNIVE